MVFKVQKMLVNPVQCKQRKQMNAIVFSKNTTLILTNDKYLH